MRNYERRKSEMTRQALEDFLTGPWQTTFTEDDVEILEEMIDDLNHELYIPPMPEVMVILDYNRDEREKEYLDFGVFIGAWVTNVYDYEAYNAYSTSTDPEAVRPEPILVKEFPIDTTVEGANAALTAMHNNDLFGKYINDALNYRHNHIQHDGTLSRFSIR